MDLGLTGKNVIVTGSTSNLGYAIAKVFIKEGANVASLDDILSWVDNLTQPK